MQAQETKDLEENEYNKNVGRMERLLNFRPVFLSAICFCFGVFIFYTCYKRGVMAWWICLLFPLGVAPFLFSWKKIIRLRSAIYIALLICAFALGGVISCLHTLSYRQQIAGGKDMQAVGCVVEKVKGEDYASIAIDRLYLNGERVKGKLIAYLPLSFYENVRLADEVLLVGELENYQDNFHSYRMQNNLRYCMSTENCSVSGRAFRPFLVFRERMQTVVESGMDERNAAVTIALLLGDSSGMDEQFLSNVRYGGVAHIFAVSGLHIGSLFAACLFLFSKTRLRLLPKPFHFLSVAATLLFYGCVCGFSPSVARAIVMCLVGYAAFLLKISSDATETLGFACICTLGISPVSLFTAGFQLSFCACLGIIWFARPLQNAIEARIGLQKRKGLRRPLRLTERLLRFCISLFCVSFCATLLSVPTLFRSFGYLSGWALLLNIFFTPIVSACFSLLLALVWIACLLPKAFSPFVLYLPRVFLSAVLLIFDIFDFSTLTIAGLKVPFFTVLGWLGLLAFFTDKWNLAKKDFRLLRLIFLFMITVPLVLANL